jgi:gamma-glutamylcyclotransferase (GGCT)/AIG2-like uncharacterized protein YtfP
MRYRLFEAEKRMKYFAYGSNMCMNRLRNRVPSCRFHVIASIKGYVLKFHKRSNDGSGKCNIITSDNNHDEVIGVIFEIDETEKPQLDRAEGLGEGYHEECIELVTPSGNIKAFTYIADPDAIDESLRPYTWYKDFVLYGAQQHRLPDHYIDHIRIIEAQIDPDTEREESNRRLLPC